MRHPWTSTRVLLTILSLSFLYAPSHARKEATSFCKCLCFQNSTIIPLNSAAVPLPSQGSSTQTSVPANQPEHTASPRAAADQTAVFVHPKRWPADDSKDEGEAEGEGEGEGEGETSSQDGQQGLNEETDRDESRRQLTCVDCNRAFCLNLDLDICKDAKEEDVYTSCFQRDSIKDETVILSFLAITAGLLGFAVLRPFLAHLGLDVGLGIGVGVGGSSSASRKTQNGGYGRLSGNISGIHGDDDSNNNTYSESPAAPSSTGRFRGGGDGGGETADAFNVNLHESSEGREGPATGGRLERRGVLPLNREHYRDSESVLNESGRGVGSGTTAGVGRARAQSVARQGGLST